MARHGEHIPCDPERECRLRDTIGCFEDIDHRFSPRTDYRTEIEKEFRSHVLNKVLICRDLHNERHATEGHKPKPTRDEMLQFLTDNKGE